MNDHIVSARRRARLTVYKGGAGWQIVAFIALALGAFAAWVAIHLGQL